MADHAHSRAARPRAEDRPANGHGVDTVVDRLIGLGLDAPLAEAYVALSTAGPAKPSELARSLHVGRTETYRLLHRLVDLRFAVMTLDRPVQFAARGIDEVLDELDVGIRARASDVARAREELRPMLVSLHPRAPEGEAPFTFRILKGRDAIVAEFRRLALEAQERLDCIWTLDPARSAIEQNDIPAIVLARAREGVLLRTLVRKGAPPDLSRIANDLVGLDYRTLGTPRPLLVGIADEEQLVSLCLADPSTRLHASGDVAIATDAPALVDAHLALFDAWWDAARQ